MLVSYEGRGVKLIDFGIAESVPRGRHIRPRRALLRASSRTCRPSEFKGKPTDQQSDIFTTGIVLYELLLRSERLCFHPIKTGRIGKIKNVKFCHRPPQPFEELDAS